jgi:hypothetical protein
MIRPKEFREFETALLRKEKTDFKKNFRIVEALYKEAVALGVMPLKDPLEGLDVDLRVAEVVNSVSKTSKENSA